MTLILTLQTFIWLDQLVPLRFFFLYSLSKQLGYLFSFIRSRIRFVQHTIHIISRLYRSEKINQNRKKGKKGKRKGNSQQNKLTQWLGGSMRLIIEPPRLCVFHLAIPLLMLERQSYRLRHPNRMCSQLDNKVTPQKENTCTSHLSGHNDVIFCCT